MPRRLRQRLTQFITGGGADSSRDELDRRRETLRAKLLRTGVSRDVTEALMSVPREEFVGRGDRPYAYDDRSMAIGHGQTISQPSLVGNMIDYLRVDSESTVLDVGTGSGYQAAILSRLVKLVVSVERVGELALQAVERLDRLGYENVEVHHVGDELGWPQAAPYDGIIVGAAAPEIPEPLVMQLRIGGKLVVPVGSMQQQDVFVVTRTETGQEVEKKAPVRFVPLIGKGAWDR